MRKIITSLSSALLIFVASLSFTTVSKSAEFFTIGTGGPTGVYFQTGNAICKMLHKYATSSEHGRSKAATEKASNDLSNADKRYNQGIKLGIQDTERLIKEFAETTLEDLKSQSEVSQATLSEQISTIESFFAPKLDPEDGDQEEINRDDAVVTFKEFQVLDTKVDELILLQKEIAANLLEMNRVRQVAAKKKKVTPKVAPKPKPNPLKFP